ncbi:MAG: CDP-alcohol phosphatidyltransferase family protein [Candidatus Aenigmarchaeota archaeon]|nr:CDP-alcohol phosphatidyltransferase family protein [Candidatus Aenigmarchaeota archaeon]
MKVNRPYNFLEKSVGKFVGRYLTPNQLSIIAFILYCLGGLFYIKNMFIYGVVVLIFSGIFDALDGLVARASKKSSIHGVLFDIYFDNLADVIFFLTLGYGGLVKPSLVVLVLSGSLFHLLTRLFGKIEKREKMFNLNIGVKRLLIIIFTPIDLNIAMILIAFSYWLLFIINSINWFKGSS